MVAMLYSDFRIPGFQLCAETRVEYLQEALCTPQVRHEDKVLQQIPAVEVIVLLSTQNSSPDICPTYLIQDAAKLSWGSWNRYKEVAASLLEGTPITA